MTSLASTKLCELEDFSHPDLLPVFGDLFAFKAARLASAFPTGAEHRKDWEVAMAVRALRDFGALRPDADILGVAAGMEDTIFYLTRLVNRVFAIDRYYDSGPWTAIAPATMLVRPDEVAPFEFDPRRLVVQHMDGRLLNYPDDSFDGVFSSGSIEHFGTFDDVAQAAYEMGRVLKPGGVLTLSTEFCLHGPAGGIGWPGQTLLFSSEHLQKYIVEASGLELIGELAPDVSDRTLAAPRDLTEAILAHVAAQASGVPSWALYEFPHIVLMHEGYVFTSVHLTLRKPEHGAAVANDWAKPSQATIQAVGDYNRSLLARAPEPPPPSPVTDAEPAPLPQTDETRADGGNADSAGSLAALGPSLQEWGDVLAARLADADASLLEIDRCRTLVDGNVRRIAGIQHEAPDWTDDPRRSSALERAMTPGGAPKAPAVRATWSTHKVEVAGGVRFSVVVDSAAADPVAQALAAGHCVDDAYLALMLQVTQPGDKIVDLGAHVGSFTLTAAAAGRSVLAVEAAPSNVALLRRSVLQNVFGSVHVVHAATGDGVGNVEFVDHGPWGHVAMGEGETTVTVPAVCVDELLTELEWRDVAFVKLDVEGSEIATLAGMAEVLDGSDAPALFFESNGHTLASTGATPGDLLAILEGAGYKIFLVDPPRLLRTRADEFQPQCIADYLAMKKDPDWLGGWRIEDGMTLGERVRRIEADSRHANPYHRVYMARALAGADEVILSHPGVQGALAALRADDVEAVREGAAWSGGDGL